VSPTTSPLAYAADGYESDGEGWSSEAESWVSSAQGDLAAGDTGYAQGALAQGADRRKHRRL
jgi:hypothetical protein